MKCLTWNLEWASPRSKRTKLVAERIREIAPDVVCYTEALRSVIPDGFVIESHHDYGYPRTEGRRKVILWSRRPWTEIDTLGDPSMPSGRFTTGISGGIRFIGVCIPWRDAHVKTGRRDRCPWQDHLSYCEGMSRILEQYRAAPAPICVLGDFNQRIPRRNQPQHVAAALLKAIPDTFTIITQGLRLEEGDGLIDHIVVSPGIHAEAVEILPRHAPCGTRLSDHPGIAANLNTISVPRPLSRS